MQALEWRDKALFGLVGGGHSWRLQSKGKKLLGLIGSTQTQVTLDHEITGGRGRHHKACHACVAIICT